MAFDVHVITESDDDLLNLLSKLAGWCEDESLSALDRQVKLLEDGDGKGRSLASTGLGLGDDIVTLDDRDDCTLLDSGRTLKTAKENPSKTIAQPARPNVPISIDTTKKFCLEIHVVEAGSEMIRQRSLDSSEE